jgi:hypothetical protein
MMDSIDKCGEKRGKVFGGGGWEMQTSSWFASITVWVMVIQKRKKRLKGASL